MALGRPRNNMPTVEWSIMMPADLALKIELRLLDPVKSKVGYGSRSKLITALLYEWEQKQSGLTQQAASAETCDHVFDPANPGTCVKCGSLA